MCHNSIIIIANNQGDQLRLIWPYYYYYVIFYNNILQQTQEQETIQKSMEC